MINELERLGRFYQTRFLKPNLNRFQNYESDEWDALCFFLNGYAFEREGRSPNYAPAAVDAIKVLKLEKKHSLMDDDFARVVWEKFCTTIDKIQDNSDESRRNEMNNPLAIKGTCYTVKTKTKGKDTRPTNKVSVAELLKQKEIPNLVPWARDSIQTNIQSVHESLMKINGVNKKIASFFLRDIAFIYREQIEPNREDRWLLQPVDTWVRRTVRHLAGESGLMEDGVRPTKDRKYSQKLKEFIEKGKGSPEVNEACACWIVKYSLRKDLSPEAVNQGIWYLSGEILQKILYNLRELLRSDNKEQLLMQHVCDHLKVFENVSSLMAEWT